MAFGAGLRDWRRTSMIENRTKGLNVLHTAGQAALALVLFWVWVLITTVLIRPGDPTLPRQEYETYALVVLLAFGWISVRTKIGAVKLLELGMLGSHRLALRQTLSVFVALLIAIVAMKDGTISRIFLFSYIPLLYTLLFLTNRNLPGVIARIVFRGRRRQKTLFIGRCGNVPLLKTWLRRKTAYGFEIVGILTDDSVGDKYAGLSVLGGIADAGRVMQEVRASQVIVTELPNSHKQVKALADLCDSFGIRIHIYHDLASQMDRPLLLTQNDGLHFIAFRQEPLECPLNRVMKRGLDICLALPVVMFVLPLTSAIVWLFQRLQSAGPLFFAQKRNGISNEEFTIYKYRSMHVDNGRETDQATPGDLRVFTAGKWIRRLSIDELPQFINVLLGDMSVVGPRPHLSEHNIQFAEALNHYHVRSFVKPGITGLAQVRGFRGETRTPRDIMERIKSDIDYLENWALSLDLLIVARTIYQMVRPPKTAY